MNTLNEIRAARLIAILSQKLEAEHNNLLTLQDKTSRFEIPANKAKRLYKDIIEQVIIDTHRISKLADKYFNHSGRIPSEVNGHTIYKLSDFAYLVAWFEL